MNRSPERVVVAVLLGVLLGACSGDSDASSAIAPVPPPAVGIGANPIGSVTPVTDGPLPGLSSDHLVRDDSGAYFCLLRRGDDLAALRRQFNQPGD